MSSRAGPLVRDPKGPFDTGIRETEAFMIPHARDQNWGSCPRYRRAGADIAAHREVCRNKKAAAPKRDCGRRRKDTSSLEGEPRRNHEALIVERSVPISSKSAIVDAGEAKSVAGVNGDRLRTNPEVAPDTED